MGPWPAVARKHLNPARGPLAVALPYGGQKPPRFTVFRALPIFSHFSDLVG